ncbi:30S ribosomal protein S9 [bacterium (Candidatus Gribaldobacteria) CG08_land_8_20_14_0_20_39_15]|uniref:Small ribosomal subunit protein uS9 n=1 Tax=bacterium (Candidatus Gribaldobacteria) CG08_land_8_20_14_0_20_39_15 TaxID=2014273 RepID=A0A2M6XUY4_9BACT|nr:MAG: 30S ribosomal protein S9 [bacterium (Candidatus Gribaldobacteria) CG08_land_8_20_14_0_20_39_15]
MLENDLETIILDKEFLEGGADKAKYIETVGRRKTAVARVRLFTQGRKGITVNNKLYTEYFPKFLHKTIEDSLEKLKCLGKFGVSVVVRGGGITGQAEAIRHGIARALVTLNPYFKKRLKKSGFLTRDPRMRERKKPGLKRARRAPQWSKR